MGDKGKGQGKTKKTVKADKHKGLRPHEQRQAQEAPKKPG